MQAAALVSRDLKAQLDDEVHVWFAEPDKIADEERLACFQSILAPDERARYGRFRSDRDGKHYLVAHALVRLALSSYAGTKPANWRFSANARGRPEIEAPDADRDLRFNLTHTDGLCACVVTRNRDCGIDAEALLHRHNLGKIADRMFPAAELQEIGDLAEGDAREPFYRHWTLREAYCKALGVGLAGSTKDFYFAVMDGNPPKVVFTHGSDESDQWQFSLMHLSDSHLVAIAVHRPNRPDLTVVTQTLNA
jgi:4'-phosphopantetheinyl transferase